MFLEIPIHSEMSQVHGVISNFGVYTPDADPEKPEERPPTYYFAEVPVMGKAVKLRLTKEWYDKLLPFEGQEVYIGGTSILSGGKVKINVTKACRASELAKYNAKVAA